MLSFRKNGPQHIRDHALNSIEASAAVWYNTNSRKTGTYKLLGTTTSTNYTDTTASIGYGYYYKVTTSANSVYSNMVSIRAK